MKTTDTRLTRALRRCTSRIYAMLLTMLASASAVQAGTWSFAAWTGDATTNISSTRTVAAYHFGDTRTATVNGVTVPGSFQGLTSSSLDVAGNPSTSIYGGAGNNLTALGGSGSAIMASGFNYQGTGGYMNVTAKNLTVGQDYTVSFFGVGFDPSGARNVIFASDGDSLLVNQNHYGTGFGIRVDYAFTATAASRSFTLTETDPLYSWGLNAVALSLTAIAPGVATGLVSDVANTSATLNATVNANGGNTTVTFQYGPTTSYGTTTTATQSPVSGTSTSDAAVSAAISGLSANTTYHYRVVAANSAGTSYGNNRTFTTAGAPAATGDFRILSLTASNYTAIECNNVAGDDRGGIALSPTRVFLTGDNATGSFARSDLSGGTQTIRMDALCTNLADDTVYVLANGSGQFDGSAAELTRLILVDGTTGALTGTSVTLSTPITGWSSSPRGIFSGYNRVVVLVGGTAYQITLPGGTVTNLGNVTLHEPNSTEQSYGPFGVAERFDGADWLTYGTSRQIMRVRVGDSSMQTVASFPEGISDLASFTISPSTNRWYFHYEGSSGHFGSRDETLGFADATFSIVPIPTAPLVSTPTSTGVTTHSATLGGNVTSDGDAAITERGVVYALTATNNNPVIDGTGVTKVTTSGTTGAFTVPVSGLTPGSGYSFKAYATNSVGTTYTSVGSFTTQTAAPTVTSPTSAGITMNTATLGGNVESDGGAAITERGVVYSLTVNNANPSIDGATVTKVTVAGTTGVFTTPLSLLNPNSSYSFKAYATNSLGTTYTSVATFMTASTTPAVTSPTSAEITGTTATLGGNVVNDGGAAITARGVVYSLTATNASPLSGSMGVTTVPVSGTTGVFTTGVTGLLPNTSYSYRPYATNLNGTMYSPTATFTTAAVNPTVANPGVTSITRTSAMFGAEVTSDGGAAITQRGVVYSLTSANANPLLGGTSTSTIYAGGTTGAFTVPTTTLAPNSNYSYKLYATNSAGTGYTSMGTFTTAANQAPAVAVDGVNGTPAHATLVHFTGTGGADPGSWPDYGARLVEGNDGSFYGMTPFGGSGNFGTLFKVTPEGVRTTILEFTGTSGANPGYISRGGLLLAADGNFYGMTAGGGSFDQGTIFKLTPEGVRTTLMDFSSAAGTGTYPFGGLVEGADGLLYGVANQGGANGEGTFFKVTTAGVFTKLMDFAGGTAPGRPWSGIVKGADGHFYGTTYSGGASDLGTLFKVTSTGVLTKLVDFTGTGGQAPGSKPFGDLLQAADGTLYGLTSEGGANNLGTAFKLTPSGTYTKLFDFTGTGGANPGSNPRGNFVMGFDGAFYAMTTTGGTHGNGTVFRMTPTGTRTTLVNFTGTSGANAGQQPQGSLVAGRDGNFYGVTERGGTSNFGTIFKLGYEPAYVAEGDSSTLAGTFADADGNATVVLTASSGSISKNNAAGTWSWSKTVTDGPTTENVVITATDDFGATATAGFVFKVTNVAPSFELGDAETLPEGAGTLSRVVAFSDPGADTWSGTVNYGDGSGDQPLSLNPNAKTFALSHFYEVGGSYTVSVTLTDDDGGTHSDSYVVSCSRILPVSGWSYAAWTGDSTSGIAAPETLWAYHFGSTTTATLNGVTIPGSFYGIVSDEQVDLWSTSVYDGAENSLTALGGSGSALIAGSFAYNGIGGATTLTLKNLTPGQVYTLSFFGVGFDTSAPRNVNFTSGPDSLVVNQNHFGHGNGIRVSYTFTATDSLQSFSLLETSPLYSWGLNAIALRSGAPGTPSVLALSTPVLNVNQGAASATVTVTRSQGSKPVSVTLATANGTTGTVPPFTAALAGTDYTAQTTVVNFAEGEMSKDVTLTLAPKAGTTIPNKRFAVSLSSPSEGAELGDVISTEVRILANDSIKPTLTVTAPAATATTLSTTSPYQVKGVAGDARGIDRVEVVLNGGVPVNAILGSATLNTSRPYSLDIEPVAGPNTLAVTAFDLRGNSTTVTRTFTHTRRFLITLGRNAPVGPLLDAAGMVTLAATPVANASALAPTTANANPKTSAIVPGTLVKLTATPKPGHVFSHWEGVPAGALLAGNVVSFTMPAGDVPVITATFVTNPFTFPAGMGNVFYGLIHPEVGTASGNASEGWFTGTLTTTSGQFSGKILIDGVTQSFSATFQGDGSTWFNVGKAKLTELSFGGRTLTLAFSGGEITTTVVQASGSSTGTARRAHYSSTRKVLASLLNQKSNTKQTVNNQGFFTVAMPAKAQPGARDASTYPQGDGFGTVMLTELGMVTYVGTLADGSIFTTSSGLISGNVSPVFAQLVTPGAASTAKGGSLGGTLAFDSTASDSDVTATNLLWIRPAVTETPGITLAQKATQLYTAGWPEGIHLDAVGALYDRTMDVQTALDLGLVNPADGNGELLLSLGRLTSEVSVTKFNIAPGTTAGTSIATKIPVTNPAFTLVTTQSTGAFGGTFTPNWSSPEKFKPAFKGILLQKGGSKGGYGFFISNRAVDLDPESGRVTLGAQNR